MNDVKAINIVGIIGVFISLFLAFFLLSIRSKNKISNRLFATYLLLSAIEQSGYFHRFFLNGLSDIVIFKNMLAFLQLPVLFFYVVSVCYSDFKLRLKHLLHAIPFVLINLVFIPRFYSKSISERLAIWEHFNSLWEIIIFFAAIHLQVIIYMVLIFILLKRYKKIYQQNFSNTASKTYDWLFQFTLFFSFVHGAVIVKSIIRYVYNTSQLPSIQLAVSFLSLAIVCWYLFKALRHPELFNSVDSNTEIITLSNTKRKNESSEDLVMLTSYMETQKPYLNPSLSIRNLSEEIKINARDLSILINQNLNQHFFDFVNEYRIKEAMELLKNPTKKEFTVLEILYEVGFNSKSSFNTAFKKYTGKTPTEFRKSA